jgi:peptidoglycan/LPS O-acetylase OafA/YrhL
MTETANNKRIYFKNLDVLRFLAAYMIVLLHCFFGYKAFFGHPPILTNSTTPAFLNKLEIVIHNLSFGVDVFFLISGFLLTYLLLAESEKTGKVNVIKFYIRRAFRIWPLYFFMILVAPLLSYFYFEPSPNYLLQFLFAGNFDTIEHGIKSVATNHLWSICIEEHFYIFCPLLVGFIPVKRLPQVLLSIIFISILFRGYVATHEQNFGMTIYMHSISRIDTLALGSLFGYLFYHNKLTFNDPLPLRIIIYSIFIIIFINVDYNECGSFFTASIKKYFFVLPAAYWIGNFLFNPNAVFSINQPNLLHRFGKISYGIYMFNPVIIFVIIKTFEKYSFQNYFIFLVLVHLILLVVTTLSYRFMELPFLNLKEKYAVIKSGNSIKKNQEIPTGSPESIIPEVEPVIVKTNNRDNPPDL